MKRRRVSRAALAPAAACTLLVGSCNTPSQAEYERQVTLAAPPGMLADRAELALGRIGFRCLRVNGAAADECTRTSATQVVASCIQRAIVHYDDTASRVVRVETRPIACVGP